MQLVPYSFSGITQYPRTQQPATPGQNQGVYITLHPENLDAIIAKVMGWFAGRTEIDLVDTGISDSAISFSNGKNVRSINSFSPFSGMKKPLPTIPSIPVIWRM